MNKQRRTIDTLRLILAETMMAWVIKILPKQSEEQIFYCKCIRPYFIYSVGQAIKRDRS